MRLLKSLKYALPLTTILLIFLLLLRGLSLHPSEVPSPLINKPIPEFTLPTLLNENKTTSNKDFLGHVTLMNVWATWCYACMEEHSVLIQLANINHINFYGLDYKDDRKAALKWLEQHGNPYSQIAYDEKGSVAIDWGVYGTPETFVIDKKGIIRFKQIGPITAEIWEHDLQPLIQQLKNEPT